jgi:hypothetical protein
MDHVVLAVIKYVFKSCGSQVALLAEEDFHVLVDQNPYSDVKLLYDETHVFLHLKRT